MGAIKRIASQMTSVLCIVTMSVGAAYSQESFRLSPHAQFAVGMEWSHLWLSGQMRIPAGGQPGSGTRINVSKVLGIDQTEASSITLHGEILDKHLVGIDYLMMLPTGLKRVQDEFRFQNKTYVVGSLVETSLDFNWLRATYGYKLVDFPGFWIAPQVGIHHVRLSATLKGPTKEAGVISNTRRLDGTYPAIGLDARYLLPYGIDVRLEIEGFHLITRGFVAWSRAGMLWEIYPDIILTFWGSNRLVHYLETNQPLNNEWFYSLTGVSGGIAVTF
jgi:hypothetical protein